MTDQAQGVPSWPKVSSCGCTRESTRRAPRAIAPRRASRASGALTSIWRSSAWSTCAAPSTRREPRLASPLRRPSPPRSGERRRARPRPPARPSRRHDAHRYRHPRGHPPIVKPSRHRPPARTSKRMMIPRVMIPTISERAVDPRDWAGCGGLGCAPADTAVTIRPDEPNDCEFKLEERQVMSPVEIGSERKDSSNSHGRFTGTSSDIQPASLESFARRSRRAWCHLVQNAKGRARRPLLSLAHSGARGHPVRISGSTFLAMGALLLNDTAPRRITSTDLLPASFEARSMQDSFETTALSIYQLKSYQASQIFHWNA